MKPPFLPQLPIVLLVGISMLFMSLILPSSKFVVYFTLSVWVDEEAMKYNYLEAARSHLNHTL